MRRLLSAVTALTLLSAQPVLAERQCASLADQSAFELQALRSELMVLAMGCHEDDRYNAFIRRYQPDLQANERMISSYFKNRYGRAVRPSMIASSPSLPTRCRARAVIWAATSARATG